MALPSDELQSEAKKELNILRNNAPEYAIRNNKNVMYKWLLFVKKSIINGLLLYITQKRVALVQ